MGERGTRWWQKEKGGKRERERDQGAFIYIGNDIIQVKVGGEPSGFWEYGDYCFANGSAGPTYVVSQFSEILMPTTRKSWHQDLASRKSGSNSYSRSGMSG